MYKRSDGIVICKEAQVQPFVKRGKENRERENYSLSPCLIIKCFLSEITIKAKEMGSPGLRGTGGEGGVDIEQGR